jgi:hypothetical protein
MINIIFKIYSYYLKDYGYAQPAYGVPPAVPYGQPAYGHYIPPPAYAPHNGYGPGYGAGYGAPTPFVGNGFRYGYGYGHGYGEIGHH